MDKAVAKKVRATSIFKVKAQLSILFLFKKNSSGVYPKVLVLISIVLGCLG